MTVRIDSSRRLIEDFTAYLIRKTGQDYNELCLTSSPSSELLTMRIVGDEFINKHGEKIVNLHQSVAMQEHTLKPDFDKVAENTFQTGISWGRIVGTIVFSSYLAVSAIEHGKPQLVQKIVNFTVELLDSDRFMEWRQCHSSWRGFVEFFKYGKANEEEMDMPWGKMITASMATIAGVAAFVTFIKYAA